MTKAELRQTFLTKRKKLSDSAGRSLSRQIGAKFIHSFDLKPGNCLHIYLPMLKHGEIDTYLLIEQIRNFYPAIRVVVPQADPEMLTMESFLFDDHTDIQVNAWGIPEPVQSERIGPENIDWIVLPLLAFDEKGYRVGYGKGFYDRYLSRCRPNVVKVGLSYFDPVNQISDIDSFDVKMDFCVTPQKVWDFGSQTNRIRAES